MRYSQLMKKIWKYISAYRLCLLLLPAAAFLQVSLSLYIPLLTGRAVDCITGQGKVDMKGVLSAAASIVLFAALSALLQWAANLLNNRLAFDVVRDMRNAAFKKIEELPLKYIDNTPSGDTVSRVITDADQFADGLIIGFTGIFTGVVTIFGTLFFMLKMDLKMGAFVLVFTPLSFFVAKFISSHTFTYSRIQSGIRGEETAYISEMISGEKVIKAFNREETVLREFDEKNERLKDASLKALFFSSLTNPSTRFVNNVIYAFTATAGAFAAVRGIMTVGELISFLSYAREYTKPFNDITGIITELQNAFASAERLINLIEEEGEAPDPSDAYILKFPDGRVEIRDLCFSYDRKRPLIKDFNLSVEPGQHVAIVGPTGCGKTTLINLLLRFYDADSGEIKVDGRDIRKVAKGSLRDSYGMVLQDSWLRSGTIKENLMMGAPEAGEDEIISAAKESHAHSFIRRLPLGYDTYITEDGGGLSAGQKQLLCITRAMLSNPSMLILDEATSSVDTRTELRIQRAFQKMMKGKTAFIVAHRLSTVRDADIILVMKDGNIIESGNHDELIKRKGFYYELYQSQFLGNAI